MKPDTDFTRDVSDVAHSGTGDLEITIQWAAELKDRNIHCPSASA